MIVSSIFFDRDGKTFESIEIQETKLKSVNLENTNEFKDLGFSQKLENKDNKVKNYLSFYQFTGKVKG